MDNYKFRIIVNDNDSNNYFEIATHISSTDNVKKERAMWYNHYAKWLNDFGFLTGNRTLQVKMEKIEKGGENNAKIRCTR